MIVVRKAAPMPNKLTLISNEHKRRAEHSAWYTLRVQGEKATGLHNLSLDLLSEAKGCRAKPHQAQARARHTLEKDRG